VLDEPRLTGPIYASAARLFVDGALSNISNPKIANFCFAFLPQFVLPGATHPRCRCARSGSRSRRSPSS
jgi:threonine/homoserine/homoserine lactone efflux protein